MNEDIKTIYIHAPGDQCVGIGPSDAEITAPGDFIFSLADIPEEDQKDALEETRADLTRVFSSLWGEAATVTFDFEIVPPPTTFPKSHEEAAIISGLEIVKCSRCGWHGYPVEMLDIYKHEPKHGKGCSEIADASGICPVCGCFPEYIGHAGWDFYEPFWKEDLPF